MKDFPNSHSGLLEQIIQNKQSEVAAAKLEVSTSELIDKCASISPPISLRDAIANRSRPENDQKQATVALIAEVKSASPSAGLISRSFDPLSLAENYAKSGAGAISVLTDKKYFNGNNSYLEAIRKKVSFPILRKDFIIDRYQLFESRSLGADAILLIVAALPPALLSELFLEATELGMDVLVEVHDHLELEQALSALRSIPILGINNRDLRTFEVDLDTTSRLLKDVPDYSM
ncbi:MAG: indole-3-glycerol-phosphate synthase, partial [Bdellovibrionales bacterium]|nr:indole-3-glycerol-phosphate synthase [Bdellovibrionales bacterium]